MGDDERAQPDDEQKKSTISEQQDTALDNNNNNIQADNNNGLEKSVEPSGGNSNGDTVNEDKSDEDSSSANHVDQVEPVEATEQQQGNGEITNDASTASTAAATAECEKAPTNDNSNGTEENVKEIRKPIVRPSPIKSPIERSSSAGPDSPSVMSPIVREDSSNGSTIRPTDFEIGEMLGEGAYSRVVLGTQRETGEKVAIKIMEKRHILKEKKQMYVKMERDILNLLDHPNIIKLLCTFQDAASLYFVLELCEGGELFSVLKEYGTFGEPIAKFYAAEIISALKYMHSMNVIHRDLKPENILVSENGHIKLIDFGTARIGTQGLRNTFCGTAEYVSPEVLQDNGACPSSDLWAVGCIIFQFFSGKVPFRGDSEYLTFQLILALDYTFPEKFPDDARDLVQKLLVLNPEERLGAGNDGKTDNNMDNLCAHPFFAATTWDKLHEQTPPPKTSYLERPTLTNVRTTKTYPLSEQWSKYLVGGENVRHSALVIKRRGLFSSKKRQLLLTTFPRLIYIDLTKEEIKGQILLNSNTVVSLKSPREFVVQIPGRSYYFEDQSYLAPDWVKKISEALQQFK